MSTVVARASRLLAGRGGRSPDPAAILGALPVAVILLDPDNRFRHVNHAAEQFIGISTAGLAQLRLNDLLPPDNPLFLLLEQVRHTEATISDHDLNLDSPRLHKRGITVQASPLPEEPGAVLLVMQDASAARALDRQLAFRGAARSVTGMAAILAHEVKNPLSGIRGAAQLLEASVGPADRELAELIRDEADRIRDLVDRMEAFGEKPIARTAVNIHRVLEHVRKLAQSGFAAHVRFQELYDPSLPPVWANRDQLIQVVLNLVKERRGGSHAGRHSLSRNHLGDRIPARHARRHSWQHGAAGPAVVRIGSRQWQRYSRGYQAASVRAIRHLKINPAVALDFRWLPRSSVDHGGLIEVDSRPGRTEFRLHLPVVTEKDADQ